MRKNSLVTKSNNLIETPLNLGVVELRIIFVLISTISPNDEEFKPYRFKISDFAKLIGVKNKNVYQQIKDYTYSLMSQPFYVHDNLQVTWLASAEYFPGEGMIEVEFSPKLKPYLLQLKEKFTTYRLQDIIKLKSAYAMRIYELLKQYERIGTRTFTIQRLKELLGVEDQYPVYSDFKKRVIVKAQEEINKHTDIKIDYTEIKSGRKVSEVKFTITSKTPDKKTTLLPNRETAAIAQPNTSQQLSSLLKYEFGLKQPAIQPILAEYSRDYIMENLDKVRQDVLRGKVKDIPAYTMAALKHDYRTPKTGLQAEQERLQEEKSAQKQKVMEAENYYKALSVKVSDYIQQLSAEELQAELSGLKASVKDKDIDIIEEDATDPHRMTGAYFQQFIQKKFFADYTIEVYRGEQVQQTANANN
ncbi:replication initiation protein [Paenibacillus dauci]|uniref:replication initiation protein n=1 Tax=Paenibacillus dauci TaxID=1567106 RepID=UPI0006981FDD|nr:replication initiation protein [Paenibacillus dauci]